MAAWICYFALVSSMTTNIHYQAKEVGILRSMGLHKGATWRIYVWEAFVLVLSASLLGVVVGVVMGYTLVLQQSLFNQLPLPFVFPTQQLIIILSLALAFAFLSSFAPIRQLINSRSITYILHRSL